MARYRGKNTFYDGWLACYYGEPFDELKDVAWREGWRMGNETNHVDRIVALGNEIVLGMNIELDMCADGTIED